MAQILRCTSMGNQWHAVLMNKQQDLGGRLKAANFLSNNIKKMTKGNNF